MLRLTEALDLSIDQQGAIISLIDEVQATASDEVPVIEDLVILGKAVEEGLAKLLMLQAFASAGQLPESRCYQEPLTFGVPVGGVVSTAAGTSAGGSTILTGAPLGA